MEFYFVSYWKAHGDGVFELDGIIGASEHEVAGYFPNDPEGEVEFRKMHRDWHTVHSQGAPLVWLRQLARSGNGVTEEYDDVRIIAARSLKQALRNAYDQTLEEYGSRITLFPEGSAITVEDLGDPFAELLTPENGRPADGMRSRVRPGRPRSTRTPP
jgi:hypothetical protein